MPIVPIIKRLAGAALSYVVQVWLLAVAVVKKLVRSFWLWAALWLALLVAAIVYMGARRAPNPPVAATSQPVIVYEDPAHAYELPRNEAIEQGLTHVAERLQLALLAAAALFWFVVKFYLGENGQAPPPPPQQQQAPGGLAPGRQGVYFFWNTMLAATVSMATGFLALLAFTDLATRPAFSLGHDSEIQFLALVQLATLALAAVLFLCGVARAIRP